MPLEDLNAWWKSCHRHPVLKIQCTANARAFISWLNQNCVTFIDLIKIFGDLENISNSMFIRQNTSINQFFFLLSFFLHVYQFICQIKKNILQYWWYSFLCAVSSPIIMQMEKVWFIKTYPKMWTLRRRRLSESSAEAATRWWGKRVLCWSCSTKNEKGHLRYC